MPQIHLYTNEMLKLINQVIGAGRGQKTIWGNYGFRLSNGDQGGKLRVLKVPLTSIGSMVLSREGDDTTCFSTLKTDDGYEGQGIGSLVVMLGVLFAVAKNDTYVKLGESDTNLEKGGHFWTSIGLSESKQPVSVVLERMLAGQRRLAARLGVTIDPNALLVEMTPVNRLGGRPRSNSLQ